MKIERTKDERTPWDCMHLPAAVPEIEHEVSHEFDIAVLDVDCCSESTDIFGDVVAEDDSPHRRLARATFAHQQHFPLLLAARDVHLESTKQAGPIGR